MVKSQNMTRRAPLGLGASAVLASRAWAQDAYLSSPVTIVVPFAAGDFVDVYARLLSPPLQAALHQSFIVDDRPSAGSIIGTEYIKNSPADGYTLLLISSTHTVNETLFAKKPYKLMTDFTSIAPINASDLVLATRPDLGANTVADDDDGQSKTRRIQLCVGGPPHAISHGRRVVKTDGWHGRTLAGGHDVRCPRHDDRFIAAGKVLALATTACRNPTSCRTCRSLRTRRRATRP